jgi:hypothetical protein
LGILQPQLLNQTKFNIKVDVNNLHQFLGHCNKAATRITGKFQGYDVVGDYKTCEASSVGKAKQKNINKDWKGGSVPSEKGST